MSPTTATLYEPGYVIAGKYELESLLGQGGMGVVWRARNIALESPVAIKVVRATRDKALLRSRLLQEARAAAKLTHPAIVKVFDVGQTESNDPFIVMELLEGESLGKILENGERLPAIQAVRTLLPIADALWLAHGKGIVHRDLKPDNVFIVQHDGSLQPKLLDFGIVKMQEGDVQSHLTQAGDVLGSPDYMSPEQARGLDDVSHFTDVWSFCVVLYQAIAGRTPFIGANYNALLRQIVEDTPPSLTQLASADAELSAIVARGLSKQPEQRFASMGELGRALASWLQANGVTEDICGTTLDAKWLRGADVHGRSARATLSSITDAWQSEADAGSGVRRNDLGPPVTLRASARQTEHDSGSELAASVSERPNARPKWRLLVATLVAALMGLVGFALAKRTLFGSQPQTQPAAAVAPAGPLLQPASAAPSPQPATVGEKQDAPSAEQVSSAAGQASAVEAGAKPAPPRRLKRGLSPGKAKAKPGDLISPY